MTDNETPVPDRGTPAYAAAEAALLARTAHVWAVPKFNSISADGWGADVLFVSDEVAARVARLLGMPDGFVAYDTPEGEKVIRVRTGAFDGIKMTVTSIEPIPDGEVAA